MQLVDYVNGEEGLITNHWSEEAGRGEYAIFFLFVKKKNPEL